MNKAANDPGYTALEMGCMAYNNQRWPRLQSVAETARKLNVSLGFLDRQVWRYCALLHPPRS